MSLKQFAKILGRRGGKKRAKNLSPQRRRGIAAKGAKARTESLKAAKRIGENFRYLEVIRQLSHG